MMSAGSATVITIPDKDDLSPVLDKIHAAVKKIAETETANPSKTFRFRLDKEKVTALEAKGRYDLWLQLFDLIGSERMLWSLEHYVNSFDLTKFELDQEELRAFTDFCFVELGFVGKLQDLDPPMRFKKTKK